MKPFVCRRRGSCCRWTGCVRMPPEAVDAAAAFLNLAPEEFIERFTELMPDRSGLTLREKPDGSCIFLLETDPPSCRIQPVKPEQCRNFPERWNFPGWEELCAGGRGMR